MSKTAVREKKLNVGTQWFIIDAKEKVLGRLSTQIAMKLMGKDKATWTPNADPQVSVVVVNASKVVLTGQKEDDKKYYRYSGYPGGLRETSPKKLRGDKSDRMIYSAVKGMLPKNKLADKVISRLFVYSGSTHPHDAQKPQEVGN